MPHSFAPRRLIFKLQQETNFLKPENESFENVSLVTFKEVFDIPLLNNLFISLIELKTFLYIITYLFLILTYLFL